jgi:hypothetical protein
VLLTLVGWERIGVEQSRTPLLRPVGYRTESHPLAAVLLSPGPTRSLWASKVMAQLLSSLFFPLPVCERGPDPSVLFHWKRRACLTRVLVFQTPKLFYGQ